MTRALPFLALAALASLGLACGPTNILGDQDGGGGGHGDAGDGPRTNIDAAFPDAPVGPQLDAWQPLEDASERPDNCAAQGCPNPVLDNCGTTEICGNGLDDNCNGEVDEGCTCVPGKVQPCFLGPPGRRNVGMCQDGTQRCQGSGEFGTWGPCEGGIWPSPETCDGQDNDCNGCVDDNPLCCEVAIQCPNAMETAPFTDFFINGTLFYSGAAQSFTWTVIGGPCDQLLWQTSNATSYTLNGAHKTTVTGTPGLTFHPTLSGDYTVTFTVVTAAGDTLSCTFIVHVKGPGFRTELCWDTTGTIDLDLHVHRSGTTTPWFTTDGSQSGSTNNDDCYYMNCKPPSSSMNWGYANTSVDECKGAPGGGVWTGLGYCHNPRLDVDNISTPGQPENINVDNPNNNDKFRVMVHFFGYSNVVTHPMVNIYCGGNLKGTFGASPDVVPGFDTPGSFNNGSSGAMWRVVDVTTQVSGGVTTGCDLQPLYAPPPGSGYWVTHDTNLSY